METTIGYKLANRRETLPTYNDIGEDYIYPTSSGGAWHEIDVWGKPFNKVNEYPAIPVECIGRGRYKIKHR